MNDSFSTAEDEESEEPDAESLLMKTQGGIEKVGRGISSSLDNARFAEKASGFGGWMETDWTEYWFRLEVSSQSSSIHHPSHSDIPNCSLARISFRRVDFT